MVFFFLVVSVQITFATAWSCAIAPPLPRFERKNRVFTKNIEKKNTQVTVSHTHIVKFRQLLTKSSVRYKRDFISLTYVTKLHHFPDVV